MYDIKYFKRKGGSYLFMNSKIKQYTLTDLNVIKRSGEVMPFYTYKINYILEQLELSLEEQQQVQNGLYEILSHHTSVTTVEIHDFFG